MFTPALYSPFGKKLVLTDDNGRNSLKNCSSDTSPFDAFMLLLNWSMSVLFF